MRPLALTLLLTGCATMPLARPDIDQRAKSAGPPTTAASLYVYRPSSILGAAVYLGIHLDGTRVATLGPGHYAVLTVRPGEHVLGAKATGSDERTIVVEAGRAYFFKARPTFQFTDGAGAELMPVTDEREGRADLAACSMVADPLATALRDAASLIARINVKGVAAPALAAVAVAHLDKAAGPDLAPSPDIDAAALRLRAARPGLDEPKVIAEGIQAMIDSVRQPPAAPEHRSPGAAILERATGLYVRPAPLGPVVAGAVPGSPAAAAGLTPGLEIRDVQVLPPDGAEVRFSVAHPLEPSWSVTLRPVTEDAGVVECSVIGGRVLYLRPHQVVQAAARRVRDYGRAAGGSASSVILDLRGVTGGRPDGAADLADTFIAAGATVVLTGAKEPADNTTYQAAPGTSVLEQARLVALVDGATVGAAEAVAAAIQDRRRGLLRSERTRGGDEVSTAYSFGRYQTSIPTAALGRPNGQPLRPGVTPDVEDDGLAPGPDGVPAGAPCPGDAVPGVLPGDPAILRAAAALLSDG